MATKKKPSKKATNNSGMRSFKLSPPDRPFLTFKATNQTFYWILICLFVLALGMWVTFLSVRVQDIYDRIDLIQQESHLYKS